MSMKNSNDTIGNRTRDLPACGAVPQLTATPRDPAVISGKDFSDLSDVKFRSPARRGV
jgi:hypothetical protein